MLFTDEHSLSGLLWTHRINALWFTGFCHYSGKTCSPQTRWGCLSLKRRATGFYVQSEVFITTTGKCPKQKSRAPVTYFFVVSYHSLLAAASGTVIMSVGLVENLHHCHQNTLGSAKKHIQKKQRRYFNFTLHKGCTHKIFAPFEAPPEIWLTRNYF